MTYHKEFACYKEGCGGIICLLPEQEAKMRRTHESFKCPFGHGQGFYGKTDQEKRIEQLESKVERLHELIRWRAEQIEYLRADLRSARARIGAKTRKLRAVA